MRFRYWFECWNILSQRIRGFHIRRDVKRGESVMLASLIWARQVGHVKAKLSTTHASPEVDRKRRIKVDENSVLTSDLGFKTLFSLSLSSYKWKLQIWKNIVYRIWFTENEILQNLKFNVLYRWNDKKWEKNEKCYSHSKVKKQVV